LTWRGFYDIILGWGEGYPVEVVGETKRLSQYYYLARERTKNNFITLLLWRAGAARKCEWESFSFRNRSQMIMRIIRI